MQRGASVSPPLALGVGPNGVFSVGTDGVLLPRGGTGGSSSLPVPADWPLLYRVEISGDSEWVVAVAGDSAMSQGILAWPLTDSRPPLRIPRPETDLGVHASQPIIASTSDGGPEVIVHHLRDGSVRRLQRPADLCFGALALADDWLACMTFDGKVGLLSATDGAEMGRATSKVAKGDVEAMVASHDGQWLAAARTGCDRTELWRCSPNSGDGLRSWLLGGTHRGQLTHLTFSRDSRFVASASTAEVFIHAADEAMATKPIAMLAGSGPIAFSPDSTTLYFWQGGSVQSQTWLA